MEKRVFDKSYLRELSEMLKEAWREAPETEPGFPEDYPEAVRKGNEERISGIMERGKQGLGEYPESFFAFRKRKKWKKRMEKMLEEILWKEPLLDIGGVMGEEELGAFQACLKEFLRKVRKFDKDLGLEDMGQAVRNYMVYMIFLVLNGQDLKYRPAAFGYSMLYPYTDNYIDSPDRTEREKEHFNRMIEGKLRGEKVKPSSRHERKTAGLLGQVEADYGRPHEVYGGLLLMLEAQEGSLRQEERWKKGLADRPAEDDILGVSVYKGGVSVLMDRYFVDVPFSERDMYFYYGFGFLLQLCDDLQDIVQDKREGNPTVFSICGTQGEAVRKVNKLLHFTRELFESCDTCKQGFKAFLLKNCYLLILASAAGSRDWMEDGWLAGMERKLPVGMDFLLGFGGGILGISKGEEEVGEGHGSAGERRNLMKMLDVLIAD